MKLNKAKILKVLFKLSFLPYILLILLAIYNSIFGFTFILSTSYGLDAFWGTIVIFAIIGCTDFPIFPIALLYEIFYLIWMKKHKKKLSQREEKHGDR